MKSRLLPSLSGGAQAGASQHFAGHRECKPDPKASSSACTQSCFLLGHALHCCQQSVWLHLVFFPFRMALVSCPEQTLPIQHLPGLEDPRPQQGTWLPSFYPPFPSAIYKSITWTLLPKLLGHPPLGEDAKWELGLSNLPNGIAGQLLVAKKSRITVRPGWTDMKRVSLNPSALLQSWGFKAFPHLE